MKLDTLVPCLFLERLNRFTALVEVNGERVQAHLANSGRLRDVLVPGRKAFVVGKHGAGRCTHFDLALVSLPEGLVSVDARVPGALVAEALTGRRLWPFRDYTRFCREVVFGDSRLDFKLENRGDCLLEVKSVTKVRNGTAMFPDAVTSRGKRHMGALVEARRQGLEAAVVWVVQRPDALRFSPDDETDPEFGTALRAAVAAGVMAHAFKCAVSLNEIKIVEEIPVEL